MHYLRKNHVGAWRIIPMNDELVKGIQNSLVEENIALMSAIATKMPAKSTQEQLVAVFNKASFTLYDKLSDMAEIMLQKEAKK